MSEANRTALILGATGGIGRALAEALQRQGWRLRCLHRRADELVAASSPWAWVRGDAMRPEDVVRAAEGAKLIVHAVNPPGYQNWAERVPAMAASTVAAAHAHRADIFLPGTVYNFGPDAGSNPSEDAPQHPLTRKGRIRVELEAAFEAAVRPGTRVLVLRAGDYFGPRHGNGWLPQVMVRPGRPVRSVMLPARPGVAHQWAYLPDVAEAAARLIEGWDGLPDFSRFHFEGHVDRDGRGLGEAIRRVIGREVPLRAFPWFLLPAMGLFSETMREVKEMRYLWQQPLVMPNRALRAVLGEEPHTPLDEAVRRTLVGLGCLPSEPEGWSRAEPEGTMFG